MNKGIYKITNLKNNKVYIGQTENFVNREQNHFYWLDNGEHHNEHLQKSYNKYGKDNFIFEVIEETEDLDTRELYWINENGGINSKLNYNMKDPLSMQWSDYVRVKQSKNMLGENNPNYGNKWSEEKKEDLSKKRKGISLEERIGKEKADLAKQKMSKSQDGRKHSKETIEKIRNHNIGENNPAYGLGDRQRGENNPFYGKESPNRKPVQKYTKNGILIKEYDFITQVREDGFNPSNVLSCAMGRKNYKTAGGFVWEFKK